MEAWPRMKTQRIHAIVIGWSEPSSNTETKIPSIFQGKAAHREIITTPCPRNLRVKSTASVGHASELTNKAPDGDKPREIRGYLVHS